ncbi:hypothetical protein V8F33_012209 [Rhypophila sp. PSN 637]
MLQGSFGSKMLRLRKMKITKARVSVLGRWIVSSVRAGSTSFSRDFHIRFGPSCKDNYLQFGHDPRVGSDGADKYNEEDGRGPSKEPKSRQKAWSLESSSCLNNSPKIRRLVFMIRSCNDVTTSRPGKDQDGSSGRRGNQERQLGRSDEQRDLNSLVLGDNSFVDDKLGLSQRSALHVQTRETVQQPDDSLPARHVGHFQQQSNVTSQQARKTKPLQKNPSRASKSNAPSTPQSGVLRLIFELLPMVTSPSPSDLPPAEAPMSRISGSSCSKDPRYTEK